MKHQSGEKHAICRISITDFQIFLREECGGTLMEYTLIGLLGLVVGMLVFLAYQKFL